MTDNKQRERLIELLNKTLSTEDVTSAELITDYLLANGVIAPPVMVGQTVYVIRSATSDFRNLYLREERVDHFRVFGNRTFMCVDSERTSIPDYMWDETVFLTREEAEAKLKEMEEDNNATVL